MQYENPDEVRASLPNKFWKPTTEGQLLRGKFLGYSKSQFTKEVKSENDRGETVVTKRPVFQVAIEVDGAERVLPSQVTPLCINLDVKAGTVLTVTYEGEDTERQKPGMNAPKKYTVEVT